MRIVNAIGNTVLLNKVNIEETTKGGLIIESNKLTPIYEIVSMGDLAKNENLFNVGDKVVIRNTVGSDVYIDSSTMYKSVKWWEIEGIIE